MTAPTTSATPKIALDQRAPSRHDNAYLFGAVRPARGVGAALALPYADTA